MPEDPVGSDLVWEDGSFANIVAEFVEGLSSRLETMADALRTSDFEALRVAAHQLKGSGGGFGYAVLSERAAELERCAKDRGLQDCTAALDHLRQIVARVVVDPPL